jgi:hypothetical protein
MSVLNTASLGEFKVVGLNVLSPDGRGHTAEKVER